jgi:hypothetical protein
LDTSNGCKRFQVHLEWWWKHESLFSIVDFLASQMLGIVGFQIEIKKNKMY